MNASKIVVISVALLSMTLASFLMFQNLGVPAIRVWDEAIYADNALDMYSYGDPVVMHRNGEVTLYNTKPPLVIWLQTLSMHLFGPSEFAVRFPSALAGILTCLLLLLFAQFTLKDIRPGLIAVLILSTTYGFVHQHVVKTGDLDAVLVFWTTGYTLLFIHFLITQPEHYKAIFAWIGVGVAGAFLSKSVAGFIPVAGLAVCAVWMRKGKWILTRWDTWIVAGVVLAVCMGYYVLREVMAPGYLNHMFHSEYTRFLDKRIPWHSHPWYYYFWNWERLDFFTPYVYILPFAIVSGFLSSKQRTPVALLSIQSLVFVGILSYPIVKLMWYDAPVYPLLALICALGFIAAWDWLAGRISLNISTKHLLLIAVSILLFFFPVKTMYQRNQANLPPVDILEREGYFVRQLRKEKPELKDYHVLMVVGQNAHYTQLDFYLNRYNRYEACDIGLLRDTTEVRPGDTVLCCQEKQIAWLGSHFDVEKLDENEIGCVLVKLTR